MAKKYHAQIVGVMTVSKKCCDCIHWRDTITGYCDYYSWPMDADDDEPCRAYEPVSTSDNYVPVMMHELVELEERIRGRDWSGGGAEYSDLP